MNAIDFIKKHGVEKVKQFLESNAKIKSKYLDPISLEFFDGVYRDGFDLIVSDLKRLVENVELVEHFGNDLVGAKQLLEFYKDCKTIELSGSVITVARLEQAIADYESIYCVADMGDDSHIDNHVSPLCKVGVK